MRKTQGWLFAVCAVVALAMGCGGEDDGGAGAGVGDAAVGAGGAGGRGAPSADAGAVWNGGGAPGMGGTPGAGGDPGGWGSPGAGGEPGFGGEPGAGGDPGDGQGAGGAGGGSDRPGANTNVNLGGTQDFGYIRSLLAANRVPMPDDFDSSGFFAEHHTPLPQPDCGERVCLQAMLGVMGNLANGGNCTLLQVGLNSPIAASPDNRPPLNLVVVVDVSGSMDVGGKLDFVRDGLAQTIAELFDDDQLAIVKYSDRAEVVYELAPMRGNRNDMLRAVESLVPEGSTNLHDGLRMGYEQALAVYDSGRQNRVILLSDGQATAGVTDTDAILTMSRRFNSDGVGLTTVGLGLDFNRALMSGLAQQGDGNFYFLENAAAVEEVFTEELSYFTVPVAFDVHLRVREGSDFTMRRAFGSPLFTETEDGGRLDVPSVFLAHRVAHDDVGPGNGRRGGGSALLIELMPVAEPSAEAGEATVGVVEIEFREPGSDAIIRQQVEVRSPDAPGTLRAEGFFENRIVEKSFVMLNIYVGMVMASEAFHVERAPAAAIGILQRVVAAAADYEDSANDGAGDVDIALDIELMLDFIRVIEANGGRPPVESDIPEDPWPAD